MRTVLFAVVCILTFGMPAFASFQLIPVVAELAPSGAGASTTFTVQNDLDKRIPIQISIVHREVDIDGKEDLKETPDIDDLFQIFPSQLVLNAKERRAVRVVWVGDPRPKSEIAFRLIAEQLPFEVDSPNNSNPKAYGAVGFSVKYQASLYVSPPGATANLVARAKLDAPKDPKSKAQGAQLALEVENKGTAHRLIQEFKLKLATDTPKKEIEFDAKSLKGLTSQNILAGKTRRFLFPWPSELPQAPIRATLELPKE